MVIEDMIYLINVRSLPKFVSSSLDSEPELFFIDLEQDPPKVVPFIKLLYLLSGFSFHVTIHVGFILSFPLFVSRW